jgi:ATP-dependent DNA helicase RecQ
VNAFAQIKAALREWPVGEIPVCKFEDEAVERLRVALFDIQRDPSKFGSADLASLIRQLLRHEAEKYGGAPRLAVPANAPPWPDSPSWQRHGCRSSVVKMGFFEVVAEPWAPEWLGGVLPFAAVDAGEQRRFQPGVPADPGLRKGFGRDHYLSQAQAEAVRGVMLSPPGSVRLVVLPTGAGKSLVGLAVALLGGGEGGGTSVVVVPTIALATDQVRQATEMCPNARIDAWQSSLTKEERGAILERLRNGEQRILYVSPESLVSCRLSGVFQDLAKRGQLRAFVVDEAHLVGQWGTSFRPEFQSMSALWRRMRALCPANDAFRTLLMTATLTKESYFDLARFFGNPGEIETLAAVYLRPEQRGLYFQAHCDRPEEKIARVLETLRHGPRPAILYVTEVNHAKQWLVLCKVAGWQRVGLMHGEIRATVRDQTLEAWNRNELDLMVATSAFGLGMDKADVRLVVHACVPETIDRFYQEVGRGGRDGRAAASVLIWEEEDAQLAERMSSPMVISDELGLERWRSMWFSRREEDGVDYLNLRAVRSKLQWDGERNREWNLKTLLLLARAGVLEILHRPGPECVQLPEESDEDFQLRREQAEAYYPIQLIQSNPLNAHDWDRQVGVPRGHTLRAAGENWRRMEEFLHGKRPLVDILCEVYQVPDAGIRHVGLDAVDVSPLPPRQVCSQIGEKLAHALRARRTNCLLVTYPTAGVNERQIFIGLSELLKKLATQGIREIALPAIWRAADRWPSSLPNPMLEVLRRSRENFIIVRDLEEQESPLAGKLAVPRVSLLTREYAGQSLPETLLALARPAHLIVLPEECPDHRKQDRRVGDADHPPVVRLEDFQQLFKQ